MEMASSEAAPVGRRRAFLRLWLPCAIVAGSGAALGIIWYWPPAAWEWVDQVKGTWLTAIITLLLLAGWLMLFSGWRWWLRLALLVGIPAAAFLCLRVHYTGDGLPVLFFRWGLTHDEVLEAHRQARAREGTPDKLDLGGSAAADFPEYRGPNRDGVVHGPPLARDWKTTPPRQIWKQPIGGGYAAFVIAGNAAVTIEQRKDQEAVVCYDTATGRERWVHLYPALFTEHLGGPGPRATPTISNGDVFSLGATGHLVCLELASGQVKWAVDIIGKDNDNAHWGMSGAPLVYDDVVVVNPGAQRPEAAGRALVAYNRATGKPLWSSGKTSAGYSSPMLATLAGRRQILLFDADGLAGCDPKTGKELWRYHWQNKQDINVAQPLVLEGDRVFISCSYERGCAMLRVTEKEGTWSANELWKNQRMRCKFTSPVLYQCFIYGLDEGILVCLDPETGEQRWRDGRYGHGQVLLADDLLLIQAESGRLALVQATPDGFRELAHVSVLADQTWNNPALAGGKVYVRNHVEMACYDLREREK
jgi:outer membrane protein assembly factor BamB